MKPVVCFVVGTRPEAIKVAPVVLAAQRHSHFAVRLVASGQHVEPVSQALNAFGLAPDHRLVLERRSGTLAELTSLLLPEIDHLFGEMRPDAVAVQGDTSTALIATLAAFWRQIPVVHIEAGLRSGSLTAPFPEEGNRVVIDHVCALHLAPTPMAANNLAREGIAGNHVIVTGNTVVDAIGYMARLNLPYEDPRLEAVERSDRKVVLVTVHRRESWGEPLRKVLETVGAIVRDFPDVHVVLPAHPNPAVRADVEATLGGHDRVLICDPLPYSDLARILAHAALVLSDSGGIQEEAPTFGVPVLVLREVTERMEAVESGCAQLVGLDPSNIYQAADAILTGRMPTDGPHRLGNPFGDGNAGPRTVDAIAWLLGLSQRPTEFSPADLYTAASAIGGST